MTSVLPDSSGRDDSSSAFEYLHALNARMEQAIDGHVAAVSVAEYARGVEELNMLVLAGIAKSMYFMKSTDDWPAMVDGAIEHYAATKPNRAGWICSSFFSSLSDPERQKLQKRAYSRVEPAKTYTKEEFIDGVAKGTVRVRSSINAFVEKD